MEQSITWVISHWYFFAFFIALFWTIYANKKDIAEVWKNIDALKENLSQKEEENEKQDKRIRDLEIASRLIEERQNTVNKVATDVDEIKHTLTNLVGELKGLGVLKNP